MSQYLDDPLWYAKLNTGENIVMDDNNEDEVHSSWLRLKKRLKETKEKIVSFAIGFRNNIKLSLPSNADGYFFRKGVLANLSGGSISHRFIIGFYDKVQNKVFVEIWMVPELILLGSEYRDVDDDDKVGEALILNEE